MNEETELESTKKIYEGIIWHAGVFDFYGLVTQAQKESIAKKIAKNLHKLNLEARRVGFRQWKVFEIGEPEIEDLE